MVQDTMKQFGGDRHSTIHEEPTIDLGVTAATQAGSMATALDSPDPTRFDEATAVEDIRVPVVEEELVAAKKQVERHVHVHKDVVEVPEAIVVPVQREQVLVERVWVGDEAAVTTAGDLFAEFDVDVPIMGEEVVGIDRRARVVEEVRLRKERVTRDQHVSATVRKERVIVDGQEAGRGARYEYR